jgi:hypothetical protein
MLVISCNGEKKPNGMGIDLNDNPLKGNGNSSNGDGPKLMDLVKITIGTVEVPVGSASRSGKLWNYLDEEPVALKSSVLGLNGLRVGLGRAETWPEVIKALKEMTGKTLKNTNIQAVPGHPTPVVLREKRPIQTIFWYSDAMTLEGEDYPAGDNILLLSITFDEDNPKQILLTGVPQIRTTRHYEQPVTTDGFTRLVRSPKIFSFTPLRFQLAIPRNDFLIIGPGARAYRPTSLGRRFMMKKKGGMLFETVLVIRPKVERVQVNRETGR